MEQALQFQLCGFSQLKGSGSGFDVLSQRRIKMRGGGQKKADATLRIRHVWPLGEAETNKLDEG